MSANQGYIFMRIRHRRESRQGAVSRRVTGSGRKGVALWSTGLQVIINKSSLRQFSTTTQRIASTRENIKQNTRSPHRIHILVCLRGKVNFLRAKAHLRQSLFQVANKEQRSHQPTRQTREHVRQGATNPRRTSTP